MPPEYQTDDELDRRETWLCALAVRCCRVPICLVPHVDWEPGHDVDQKLVQSRVIRHEHGDTVGAFGP